MPTSDDFERAFQLVVGHEGGFSTDPRDRGNWTTGRIGEGRLVGTKFGIAAHVYPTLDIPNLTLADAHAIYLRDYWRPVGAEGMPPRLGFVLFDSAVNNGVGRAVMFLQAAIGGLVVDGALGPRTRAALEQALGRDPGGTALASEIHARRIHFHAGLSTWHTFGMGWSRRLAAVPFEAADSWPIGGQTI